MEETRRLRFTHSEDINQSVSSAGRQSVSIEVELSVMQHAFVSAVEGYGLDGAYHSLQT